MKRWMGVAVGILAIASVALAAEKPAAKLAEKRVRARLDDGGPDRRVEVVRLGRGARLGVVLEEVGNDDVSRLKLTEERGAVVKDVESDSAAERAGLKEDDVILSYQGEKVTSAAQLGRLVRETPPGRKVTLEVSRAGAVQRLSAQLEEPKERSFSIGGDDFHFEMPALPPIPPVPPLPPEIDREDGTARSLLFRDRLLDRGPRKLGLSYQDLSGQLASYFKVEHGVLVSEVETDGPAGKGGLKAGDVITKFDGKAVESGEDFRRAVSDATGGSDVTLTVQRDGRPLDLKVHLRSGDSVRRERRPTM